MKKAAAVAAADLNRGQSVYPLLRSYRYEVRRWISLLLGRRARAVILLGILEVQPAVKEPAPPAIYGEHLLHLYFFVLGIILVAVLLISLVN